MRIFLIAVWAFGFGFIGAILCGIAAGILEAVNVTMKEGTLCGIPFSDCGWIFLVAGLFLGIYGKLPGTKKNK
jgi:hypothetical protein